MINFISMYHLVEDLQERRQEEVGERLLLVQAPVQRPDEPARLEQICMFSFMTNVIRTGQEIEVLITCKEFTRTSNLMVRNSR